MRLDYTCSSSLPLHRRDNHLTCFTEIGCLVGGEGNSTGGRASRRSGRQLLGHCLPGVCTSVISQLDSLLARSRHAWLNSHGYNLPTTQIPSEPLPALLHHSQTQRSRSDSLNLKLYIDTVTSCQHYLVTSSPVFDG